MHAPAVDLERRRPVWAALSELFLDTALQPEDLQRLADTLASSGYSRAELEQILRREVGPVLLPNLLSAAGEWASFDLGRLEAEILRSERRPGFRRLLGTAALHAVSRDWGQVRVQLPPARSP